MRITPAYRSALFAIICFCSAPANAWYHYAGYISIPTSAHPSGLSYGSFVEIEIHDTNYSFPDFGPYELDLESTLTLGGSPVGYELSYWYPATWGTGFMMHYVNWWSIAAGTYTHYGIVSAWRQDFWWDGFDFWEALSLVGTDSKSFSTFSPLSP